MMAASLFIVGMKASSYLASAQPSEVFHPLVDPPTIFLPPPDAQYPSSTIPAELSDVEDPIYAPFAYRGRVLSVYDGDTVTMSVDLGFSVTTEQSLRLFGIDAPEVRGDSREAGLESRDYLRTLLPKGRMTWLRTLRDHRGKYGRFIVIIYLWEDGQWTCVNKEMVRSGHAEEKVY